MLIYIVCLWEESTWWAARICGPIRGKGRIRERGERQRRPCTNDDADGQNLANINTKPKISRNLYSKDPSPKI